MARVLARTPLIEAPAASKAAISKGDSSTKSWCGRSADAIATRHSRAKPVNMSAAQRACIDFAKLERTTCMHTITHAHNTQNATRCSRGAPRTKKNEKISAATFAPPVCGCARRGAVPGLLVAPTTMAWRDVEPTVQAQSRRAKECSRGRARGPKRQKTFVGRPTSRLGRRTHQTAPNERGATSERR